MEPTPPHALIQNYELKLDFALLFQQGELVRFMERHASNPSEVQLLSGIVNMITEIQFQALHGEGSAPVPEFDPPRPPTNTSRNRST